MGLNRAALTIFVLISALMPSVTLAAISEQPADYRSNYLTEASPDPARVIAERFVENSAAEFGLTPADLTDYVVRDEYVSKHNGVTHLYIRQRLNGIEVVNGDININVDRNGRVFSVGNRFVQTFSSGPVPATRASADAKRSREPPAT